MLLNENCDPNVYTFEGNYSLLSICYIKQKWRALDLLLSRENIDINIENKIDGSTFYGILLQQLYIKSWMNKKYQPEKYLKLLNNHPLLSRRLDRHKR